ncbi:MAG: ribosome recycling factor [Armatimonadetes bacterium]|nr:ribosome recycling factor [Armatimonadota bacterium]
MSIEQARSRMEDAIEAVRRDFATVRTGKATPALLDTVRVDAYGSKMPLNQVASVSTPEATLLVVQPFDKALIADIEKAILLADLGLNPSNDGNLIRVPIPPLNEERRKDYVRLLHKMAEEGKISIRHARKTGNDEVKEATAAHEVGEDDGHRQLDQIQKMTDDYSRRLDEMLEHKEKEVMSI